MAVGSEATYTVNACGRVGPWTARIWQHIAELRMSPRFPTVGEAGRPLRVDGPFRPSANSPDQNDLCLPNRFV
jgi:hypothetical protein